MSTWESSKACFEIANYMDVLDTVLRHADGGKWFEGLDDVKRNALNSMQRAICDIYAAAGSAWVNGTLIKRDEVLNKLGGRLSSDSKQVLREAPFDAEELLDSTLFELGLEKSLKLAKDKSMLPNSGKGSTPATLRSSKRGAGKKNKKGRGGKSNPVKSVSAPTQQAALPQAFRGPARARGARAPRGRGAAPVAKTE